ncbi:hypothetical protein [Methylomonas albis]|jgi:hypothetical protein|uniref:Uncharacterized protein n=1 Tax=Methylomonas albis TaxID=1854563 RepID=A0ABR9CVW7_9GAMM|nr:hypothetical protein [Methylomonas albis]MBD9354820.1 hypothetical protein [Methylomonas albis]CAD6877727.1 hypothetical protein [Methylomonas albis]
MNTSTSLYQQLQCLNGSSGRPYITTDGVLGYCITGPVMELPLDFKEWYQPHNNRELLHYDKAA